ncbi:MAG: ATP synthase F0 subunit B [Planctomycetes bacterium]|nr:ATP synthase F0 subunit B [Planctomycetota bacterium]
MSFLLLGSAVKFFVAQALGFLIVAIVLLRFARPAVKRLLGERTKGFEETFARLEKETVETQAQLADLKAKLADVDREAKRRLNSAVEEANQARSRALGEAHQQAENEMAKAKREIEIERSKAVLELRQEATRLTMEAADHLARAVVDDAVHGKLVEKYLDRLDAVKKS